MNNKGSAQLVIGGVSVGAIIYFIFQVWATGLVIGALEPELTKILMDLEGNMICPPELSEQNFEICFSSKGEVIVNGNITNEIQLDLEGDFCKIPIGNYENVNIYNLEKIWEGQKLYVTGIGFFNSKTIKISKIISYAKAGRYVQLLRIVKRLPIK